MTKIEGGGRAAESGLGRAQDRGPGEASQGKADRFRKAIGRKDAGEGCRDRDKERRDAEGPGVRGGAREGAPGALQEPAGPGGPLGNALLRGMELQRGAAGGAEAARPASAIGEIAQAVADRILVGEADAAGDRDVRIFLKDSVLGGTEVRVRTAGEQLQVAFLTGSADAQNVLAGRQGELASELGQRLNRAVEVTVAERDAADPDGDGRSRNRRDYETEEEA